MGRKETFKRGMAWVLLLCLVLTVPAVKAAEYTAIEERNANGYVRINVSGLTGVSWEYLHFPMFSKVNFDPAVLDCPAVISYSRTFNTYDNDWCFYYDVDSNGVYLGITDDSKTTLYYSTGVTRDNVTYDFSGLLEGLLSGTSCFVETTAGKKTITGGAFDASARITKYELHYSGIHELLSSAAVDHKLKRTIMRSLGYYGSDQTLPHETLTAGGKEYEVMDAARLPLTLVAAADMQRPAITLNQAGDSYRIMYGDTDITDIAGELSQKPDDCGRYWQAVTAQIRTYNTNYADYLAASSQQGTAAAAAEYNTAYDYYAARIANYWLNGNAENVLPELQNFPGSVAVKQAGKGGLTDEEGLRLQVFASILGKCGDDRYQANIDALLNNVGGLQWNPASGAAAIDVTGSNSRILTMDRLDNDWTKLYDDKYREYNAAADQTLEGELADAYAVAVYYAAKMYGAVTSPGTIETGNLGTIPESEYIESITLNINSSGIGMLNLDFSGSAGSSYYGIPAMKNIASIADTEEARSAYYNLNLLIAAIASYCNSNGKDFETGNNDWIDELVAADASDIVNLAEYAVLKDNINKVQACISINEALTYLGVDTGWLDSVRTVCSAGNALQAYKDMALKLQSEYTANESEPMKTFFNLSKGTYATDYLTGVALSSTFRPMQTNMYDVQSVSFVEDTDWVTRFHYPWGFYRKALYMDTDTDAAVNRYITSSKSSKGNTRIATLGDMLEPEKDIVLYIDDRFYNTAVLADKMGMAYNKVQNVEDTVTDGTKTGLLGRLREAFDVDVESIVKTGGNTAYSRSVYQHVAHVGEQKEVTDFVDSSLMDTDSISYQLKGYSDDPGTDYAKQYSVLQSYSVVSAIYRDQTLYSKVSRLTGQNPPVFVSSPNLFAMDGISQTEFNTVYNYAMLRNLEDALPLDYKSQLDLKEPLYMDIYGNIITDSGTVVIPAVANASLCGSNFNPVTVGFMYLYNKGSWKIPGDANNCEFMINECFALDAVTGDYMLTNQRFDNVRINLSRAQLSDEGVINLLYEVAQDYCSIGGYLPFDSHVYWMTEVLRGAPLEYIDKDAEMITTPVSYSRLGVAVANKLDEIIDAFYAEEHRVTILSLPNLAFMQGFEYVILYLFKIIFVVLFVLLIYRLYTDAVSGTLGLKSVFSFIMSVVMFLVTCFAVPTLLDVSYYQVNRRLLKDEALQTLMLGAEKKAEGREIGITGVQGVGDGSRLFLKMDDLSVPWYAVLDNILVSETGQVLDDLYAGELAGSSLANLPRFERQGQNLYLDVDKLMQNSVLMYDKDSRVLYSVVRSTPYESFITPYYAVLDTLVARINAYNLEHDLNNFDTKVMSGGQVKTIGLISPYLTSEDFMSMSRDPAGIRDIYGTGTTLYEAGAFGDDDRLAMSGSYWYADAGSYSDSQLDELITEIDNEARHFVARYRILLDRISDESFLEVMALSIACRHNSVFRVGNADTLEIFDIDTTSVIRLSVAPPQTVISQCSKSFARFIYDNGGTLGVVAVAFLLLAYIIGSSLKTVCLVIMTACLFMSAVVRQLVKKDSGSALEGYLITMAVMCVCNVAFSCIFKVSLNLPGLGLGMAASALVQIVLQCLYVLMLGKLTAVVVRDWRNAGYDVYMAAAARFSARIAEFAWNTGSQAVRYGRQTVDRASVDVRRQERTGMQDTPAPGHHAVDGNDILRDMQARDEERRQHAGQR